MMVFWVTVPCSRTPENTTIWSISITENPLSVFYSLKNVVVRVCKLQWMCWKCCKIRIIIFLIHAAILKCLYLRYCFIVHSICYSACVWNIINVVDPLCLCHTEDGIINLNILQPVLCKCSHFCFCCIVCLHKALFMNRPGFFVSICFRRNIV